MSDHRAVLDRLEAETPDRPTPAEMMVLLHWLTMWSGAVLSVDGLDGLSWSCVPADVWWRDWALNPMDVRS